MAPHALKQLLRVSALLPLAVVALLLVNPFPAALNGLDARFEYTRQLTLHVLGMNTDWDVAAINAAYARVGEMQRVAASKTVVNPKSRPFKLRPVEELHPANDSDWRAKFDRLFIQGEVPVVVRGLQYVDQKLFPKAREWGIKHLLEKVFPNGAKVPVFTNTTNDKSAIMVPFDEFVEGLKDKNLVRYARCLDDRNYVMMSGFSVDGLAELMGKGLDNKLTYLMNGDYGHCLFVGSSHVSTRMHSDVGTSAFMMIEGRKRWTMFPPSQSMYFLPVAHLFNVAYNSHIDIFAEDILEKYPFASLAEGWEVVIEPGDVLFFPAFTWHGVQNLDEITVGLDMPVYDVAGSLRRNPILAAGTMFNMRVWYRIVAGLLSGRAGSLKATFFEGYLKDPPKDEA